MADCDLCGKSKPTLIPVRVMVPVYRHAYPEGMWKGLCETCLESCASAYATKEKRYANGKCALSLVKGKNVVVSIPVPSLTGIKTEEKLVSEVVLKSCAEVYDKYLKGKLPPYGEETFTDEEGAQTPTEREKDKSKKVKSKK
ncbi:MAG: F420H2 dehydrogenase subunit FpoO [Methermicoccaceae archaeon]